MNQAESHGSRRRLGPVAGISVALAEMIAFFVLVRDVAQPFIEMLLVGVPIGLVLGAVAWYAVEAHAMSRRSRTLLGLLLVSIFVSYVVILNLYLGSRT